MSRRGAGVRGMRLVGKFFGGGEGVWVVLGGGL